MRDSSPRTSPVTSGSSLLHCTLALAVVLAPTALGASSIDVLSEAAHGTSNYGARLSLDHCTNTGIHPVTGTINTSTEECSQDEIESDADVASGVVTFKAGTLIRLKSGFSVDSAASFTARVDPSVATGEAFLQDNTPGAEPSYVVQYYLNPDNLSLAGGEEFGQFVAYDASNVEQFRVVVTHNGSLGEDRAYVVARNHDGSTVDTSMSGTNEELVLPPGYNGIEVTWKAASVDGTDDGELTICVNDLSTGCSLTLNHTNAGQIDYVRWGVPDIGDCTSCGFIDLDDFDSRRTGPIGF